VFDLYVFYKGATAPSPTKLFRRHCVQRYYTLYLCTIHKSNNRRVFYTYFSGREGVSLFLFIIYYYRHRGAYICIGMAKKTNSPSDPRA